MNENKVTLIQIILTIKCKIKYWNIYLNVKSEANFTYGYYYDENKNMWIYYKNTDRGLNLIK